MAWRWRGGGMFEGCRGVWVAARAAARDPILAEIWDNEDDAAYDAL